MTFLRSCLYHPTEGMKVIEREDEYKQLRETGVWFDSPTKAKEFNHEKQIRQQSKQRRSDAK